MRGFNCLVPAAFAVLMCASPAPTLRADILFDTLQNDQIGAPSKSAWYIHNFPPTSQFVGDDLRAAIPFVIAPGVPYALQSIILNVAARNNAAQRLIVSLQAADASGLPGNTIRSWSLTNLPVRPDSSGPITYPLTTISTQGQPILAPGKYWVALSTPDSNNFSDIYWYAHDTLKGQTAMLSSPLNGTAWFGGTDNNAPQPQARVIATPVPEPGAMATLAAALALALPRRRPRLH